jgi:hypothetical protein
MGVGYSDLSLHLIPISVFTNNSMIDIAGHIYQLIKAISTHDWEWLPCTIFAIWIIHVITSPLMLVCFWVPVYLHPGRLPYSNPKPIFTHWTLLLWIGKLDRHSVLWLPHSDVYVQYNFNYIRISCQFWTAMMWIIILLTIHWLLDDCCNVEYLFFALTNRFQLLCEMSGSCAHCILWLSWY